MPAEQEAHPLPSEKYKAMTASGVQLQHILHRNTHHRTRNLIYCIFRLKKTGYHLISCIHFQEIHPFFISFFNIIGISRLGIFLFRRKAAHGIHVRNGPTIIKESRKWKPFSRKPLYRLLATQSIYKSMCSVRSVTNPRTINSILIQLKSNSAQLPK